MREPDSGRGNPGGCGTVPSPLPKQDTAAAPGKERAEIRRPRTLHHGNRTPASIDDDRFDFVPIDWADPGCIIPRTMNRPRFVARRRFLSGVTATAVGFAARGVSRAQTDAGARLTIAYADAGRPIASDFVGLSYESAILAAGDYFTPENRSVLGLIRLLGADGVIRIGGNTSERTVWRADDKPVAAGSFAITPASIDQLDRGPAHPRMEARLWAQPRARHAGGSQRGGRLCGSRRGLPPWLSDTLCLRR
jgi:hypothetical protein